MTDLQTALREWVKKNPLRAYRLEHGLTMFDAASAIGVSTQSIQQWENGGMAPNPENLEKICKLAGTTPEAWDRWVESRPQM